MLDFIQLSFPGWIVFVLLPRQPQKRKLYVIFCDKKNGEYEGAAKDEEELDHRKRASFYS